MNNSDRFVAAKRTHGALERCDELEACQTIKKYPQTPRGCLLWENQEYLHRFIRL